MLVLRSNCIHVLVLLCVLLRTTVVLAQEDFGAQEDIGWPLHGHDSKEQRFSQLDQINADNVSQLGLDWSFETDYTRGHQATPIIVDGIMYFTGSWSVVYAVNAVNGELIWRFDPEVPREWAKMACCDVVNRGVAVSNGKVVVATLDARLIALDIESGTPLWSTQTADIERWPYTITGAPRIAKGKVFIGNGGAEYGVRGYVGAYDLESGEQVWRFYTVPGNPDEGFENDAMAMAASTWNGEWWKFGGGGTVWDSIVYDEELDQLYIGVGNGSPWNQAIRSPGGGDNLFLSSIVALNPDTGDYLWHYQTTPAEQWDYTATQHIMLADMEWQGQARKVIWQAPKNGFFFLIDRTNGELLSAEPFARVNWAERYDRQTGRPILTDRANYNEEPGMIYPSPIGAHSWHPMAHHPGTGLVYLPLLDAGQKYSADELDAYQFGQWHTGVNLNLALPGGPAFAEMLLGRVPKGYLLAWNPAKEQEAWRVPRKNSLAGGVLATAGDLVFQGTGDGYFTAHNAFTGAELWRFAAHSGIVAAPVSYKIDGEQYIAVLSGVGGVASLASGLGAPDVPAKGRLLAFKLGGRDALPPLPPTPEQFPLPAALDVDKDVIALGSEVYHKYCYMCHGVSLIANKAIPDLRNLPPVFYDNWDAIVRDGMMSRAGMLGFGDVLSQEEIDATYAYVLDNAHKQRASEAGGLWNKIKNSFYSAATSVIIFLDGLLN